MNNLFSTILFLVGLAMLSSCNKDSLEPIPEENNPVFKVSGKIGDQNIQLLAGLDMTFMNTETYLKNGVNQFKGYLENKSMSFSMTLADGMVDIPSFNSDIEDFKTFKIAPYNFKEPLVNYSINDLPNKEYISSLKWIVDGENQNSNTLQIYEPGKYEVCLIVEYYNGQKGSSCNEVIIGYQKNAHSVLRHLVTENEKVIAYVDSPSEAVSSIDWTIDDSLVLTSSSLNFKTDLYQMNPFNLGAQVNFKNGASRKKQLLVNVEDVNNYINDFSVLENQSTLLWDNTMDVRVKINNKEYRAIQNNSNTASIEINDIVSFEKNANGDNVSIIKGSVSCSFINVSNQEILDGEFEFSFGIAH